MKNVKLETPIVRVFRGKTWLTVYRSVAVLITRTIGVSPHWRVLRIRCELVGLGAAQLLSMKKCDENQKLFVSSQLLAYTPKKDSILYLNFQF